MVYCVVVYTYETISVRLCYGGSCNIKHYSIYHVCTILVFDVILFVKIVAFPC